MKKLLFIFLISSFWTSCGSSSSEAVSIATDLQSETILENEFVLDEMGKGFRIADSYCVSCHSWGAIGKNQVAPSFLEIKKSYREAHVKMDDFKHSMIAFLTLPDQENALMHEAVETFGMMPKFDLSSEEMNAVATYLWYTSIEKEDGFTTYYAEDKVRFGRGEDSLTYLALGKKYTLQTKAILGKNLKGTMQSKGVKEAVEFCNLRAYPLTDSMSIALKVRIKRVSDRPRNPNNTANQLELRYIEKYKLALEEGVKIRPEMQELNGVMVGYYPITSHEMCLKCHGDKEREIPAMALKNIRELYPNDLATGYHENELRGIWVIEMNPVH